MVIIMNEYGYRQGNFVVLFFRFLWHLIIASLFQFMLMYIYGVNYFTFWIMCVILSFIINTLLPMGENYSFFRHALILFCIYLVSVNSLELLDKLYSFFTPNTLWSVLMSVSVIFGIITCIGRYGNGTYSKTIESFGNIVLLTMIIVNFILFWWEGGLVYFLFRIPIIFFEVSVANLILHFSGVSHRSNNISP